MSLTFVLFAGVIGALIGSFANVVIHRLPRGESVVWPGSRCPKCGHRIRPWENVPILSWLVLRGRCSSCRATISARYPLVEALMAAGFVLLALRWPVEAYGATALPLMALFAMLLMLAWIDIDHYLLPDSLTLPALVMGLLGAFVYHPAAELPGPADALFGGAIGAGILVMVNRLGSLVLRRLRDTRERLWPIGMDQVGIAALAGALFGWGMGVLAAAASVAANLATRRTWRLPEPLLYALWLLALLASTAGLWIDPVSALAGTLAAAGSVAILGALFWWLKDLGKKPEEEAPNGDDEPIAMGFGDVKLAAVLGVMLGWQSLAVALLLAFVFGAVGGLVAKALGGSRQVPFGPYLVLGGLVALFYGPALVAWYLGTLGLG